MSEPVSRRPKPGDEDFVFRTHDSVGFRMRDTYRVFARLLGLRLQQENMPMGTWYFLRALWDEDGVTQRELSRRIGMMEPTTVSALSAMEQQGLIERRTDPRDRRRRMVHLTEAGRALQKTLLPHAWAVNEIAIEGLEPAEIRALEETLAKIKKNLDAALSEGDGG